MNFAVDLGCNLWLYILMFQEPKFEEDRAVIPVMDASLRDIDFEHLQVWWLLVAGRHGINSRTLSCWDVVNGCPVIEVCDDEKIV